MGSPLIWAINIATLLLTPLIKKSREAPSRLLGLSRWVVVKIRVPFWVP